MLLNKFCSLRGAKVYTLVDNNEFWRAPGREPFVGSYRLPGHRLIDSGEKRGNISSVEGGIDTLEAGRKGDKHSSR